MNEFENNQNNIEQPTETVYAEPVYTPLTYSPNLNNEPEQPQLTKKEKKGHSTLTVIIACVLAAFIGAASSIVVMIADSDNATDTTTDKNIATTQQGGADSSNVNITIDETASSIAEAVAKKCTNSVVGIRTTSSVSNFFGNQENTSGEGSGVIYTTDGYIITNYHVISDAVESRNTKIDVFIGTNKEESYSAEVVGYNISCDLAVIKIDAQNLTPMEFADSDKLKIGQSAVTIGAPGGLEFMGSVTYGVISGLDRIVSADSQLELIQTDAAINPGNSGGALLNAEGKLIGINSSKIAATDFEGMGFAIPSNAVKEKCDKIIARKDEGEAYLGVSISGTYTSEVLKFYGYPSGAVVSSVMEDSPAYEAGIERGDIITKFNGIAITEYTVLTDALYECSPGDTVKITIYRNGREYSAEITLTSTGS